MILTIVPGSPLVAGFDALGHAPQHFLLRVDVGEILRFHGGAESVGVERFRVVAARGAGAVDQHVDRTDRGADFLDDIGGAVRFVQIGARAMHVQAFLLQLFISAREIGRVARDDRDFRAFRGERARAGEADSLAAARDQHHFVFQPEIHRRRSAGGRISMTIADRRRGGASRWRAREAGVDERQKLPLAKRAIGSSVVCGARAMPCEPVEARMICTLPLSSACCACGLARGDGAGGGGSNASAAASIGSGARADAPAEHCATAAVCWPMSRGGAHTRSA